MPAVGFPLQLSAPFFSWAGVRLRGTPKVRFTALRKPSSGWRVNPREKSTSTIDMWDQRQLKSLSNMGRKLREKREQSAIGTANQAGLFCSASGVIGTA